MITMLRTAIALVLLAVPMSTIASAQRPAPVAEVAVGWVGFADDGIVSELLVGGAARWYVLPRIAIGPEMLFLGGQHHSHLVITGNLTVDLLAPSHGQSRAITPFVVVGGGLFQTREDFPTGPFTSNEGAFTVGGGVRAKAGERVTLGLDARLGWEAHLRVNGTIGVRLGH
jgi:hypothetical protein